MLVRFRSLILALVPVVGVPALAQAQQAAPTSPGAAAVVQSEAVAGPRLDVTAIAVRQLVQHGDSAALEQARRRQDVGRPVALMIVGGAAIVLGAAIGDEVGTVFMIGGAVALLVGLYQYLQ